MLGMTKTGDVRQHFGSWQQLEGLQQTDFWKKQNVNSYMMLTVANEVTECESWQQASGC